MTEPVLTIPYATRGAISHADTVTLRILALAMLGSCVAGVLIPDIRTACLPAGIGALLFIGAYAKAMRMRCRALAEADHRMPGGAHPFRSERNRFVIGIHIALLAIVPLMPGSALVVAYALGHTDLHHDAFLKVMTSIAILVSAFGLANLVSLNLRAAYHGAINPQVELVDRR